MLLSAAPVLVVAQSSSEIPEELTNNPVLTNVLQVPTVFRTVTRCTGTVGNTI